MRRAYFVSDIHLKDMQERNSQTLLRFLLSLREAALAAPVAIDEQNKIQLFLVGDIFDLWIGSHEFFIERFSPLVEEIQELVQAGVEVHYFEGNHDLYLRRFWSEELGVHVHEDFAEFNIGILRVRVEHGDLINPEDKGYLFLRSFLRAPPIKVLARHLPASVISLIGERASRASRKYTSTAKDLPVERIRELIRAHARRLADSRKLKGERPPDLIVSGHVHVTDDYIIDSGETRVRSVNLGSWFDKPRAFLITGAADAQFIDL